MSDSKAKVSGIGKAALLLVLSQFLSRILGVGRDTLLSFYFGTGPEADAYFAAFQVPDFFNYLMAGGGLSIAFLPMYTRFRNQGEQERADQFLASVLTWTLSIAIPLLIAAYIFLGPLIRRAIPYPDAQTHDLAVEMAQIVLPAQLFFISAAILKGALFSHGRFAAAALAPFIYNVCIIGSAVLLHQRLGIKAFAWGALLGAILGPFGIIAFDAQRHIKIRFSFKLSPDTTRYAITVIPLMLGLGLMTVDEWLQRYFAAPLSSGAVAILGYARRLMLFPIALVGQAVGGAALPALTQLHSEGQDKELNQTLDQTVRLSFAVSLILGAALLLFAGPSVSLVYSLDTSEQNAVISVLGILCLSIPGWVVQQLVARAFYARGDTWRPMILSTAMVVFAFPIYLLFSKEQNIHALAWASVIVMNAGAFLTLLYTGHHFGAPKVSTLLRSGIKMILPLGFASATSFFWVFYLGFGSNRIENIAIGTSGGIIFFAIIIVIGGLMKNDDIQPIVRLMRRLGGRFSRRSKTKSGRA